MEQYISEFGEIIKRLDSKKKLLDGLRPLNSAALIGIKNSLTHEWVYNSNRIEGNSLTLNETRIVLEEGMTVKGKSLREHFEALNHMDAIELVESLVQPKGKISVKQILEIHALILQRIEKDFAGRLRTSGVRIIQANFVPPNALKVPALLDLLLEEVNLNIQNIHPLLLTAYFHHKFVWIHPFFDGNGRTVRLISNLILMNHGFPPAIILSADRKKYYRALNQANKDDYSKFILINLQAAERTLDIYLSNARNYADDYKPISRIVEESSIPYGQEYVSLLARRGRIEAYKEGKTWYTTTKAVKAYMLALQ